MEQWNCIIVDDEDVDRLMVVSFVKRFPKLNLIGAYGSTEEAMPAFDTQKIDILFLDIDMQGMNGIDFRKRLADIPVCIFITGHAEYAVESFELDTLDFIVKPVRFDRFEKAIQRVELFLGLKHKAELFELSFGNDTIYIKEGVQKSKIRLSDIFYLEALKDYTLLVTADKKHCVWSNIGSLLKQSHFQSFVRIHKSYAVQKQFVRNISAHEIRVTNDALLPIGRNFKENIKTLL
jgi:two-component system, LytTR family, response regulator